MENKTIKSGALITSVITVLLIIVLSVLTFAVPFNKIGWNVLLVVYICSVAFFLIECGLTNGLIFGKGNRNQKILGLPIVYSCFTGVVIQIVVTIVFYVANAFVLVGLWIPIVIEVALYCFVAIQIALGFFFRARNEEYRENKANTDWMDLFRAEIKILAFPMKKGELGEAYENLYDLARGSDPVGNEKTLEAERKIDELIGELKNSHEEKTPEEEIVLVNKVVSALKERNALCKLGK